VGGGWGSGTFWGWWRVGGGTGPAAKEAGKCALSDRFGVVPYFTTIPPTVPVDDGNGKVAPPPLLLTVTPLADCFLFFPPTDARQCSSAET